MSAGLLLFRSLAPVMGLPDCTYLLLVYINSERRCVYTQQDVCWMIAMCIVKELHGGRCDDWPHRGFVPYESPVIQFLTGLRPVYQNNATLSSCY